MPKIIAIAFALLAVSLPGWGENLSPVAEAPDWNEVELFQEAMTRADFVRLLDEVYAPRAAARGLIEVLEDRASVVRSLGAPERLEIRFAKSP